MNVSFDNSHKLFGLWLVVRFVLSTGLYKNNIAMALDLYYMEGSPACRLVLLTARALGITLNIKTVNFENKEHLTPEYLKMNPQHTVPTLVDNGFVVAESRAIITYLVDKFAKGNPLYPEDLKTRNLVDQRLYFDIGTLVPAYHQYFDDIIAAKPVDAAQMEKVDGSLVTLNGLLEGKSYIAGPNLTVADLSLATSLSYFEVLDIDYSKHDNIKRWYTTVQNTTLGWEELTKKDLELVREWISNSKNKKE